ncbi:MAG: transcription antitermination factor NusB [Chitinophagaceae bacterium]|jgi:N utilization substance protein B|nr:transcription antitermination factor NusB [Chitinophagaceae bacterium]
MISRRNIRVKVMQTLYAVETADPAIPDDKARKILESHFEQSRLLFTYLVYLITETARYAESDARNRASKHLPSKEDLSVNTKIAGNTILWQILEDASFRQAAEETKIRQIADPELVRSIYQKLTATEAYQAYITQQSREKKDEKDILAYIFTDLILPDELVIGHLEEFFTQWDDDADMMVQLVMNYLSKPASYNFQDIISGEKKAFATRLLQTAIEKKDYCLDLIRPKLKNWDAERIAMLDMILMRMGVCELLYFETIPAKVTINEYIDLAKEYSTPQSGQFVNGILDNIHKEMEQAGTLRKVDFKKQ